MGRDQHVELVHDGVEDLQGVVAAVLADDLGPQARDPVLGQADFPGQVEDLVEPADVDSERGLSCRCHALRALPGRGRLGNRCAGRRRSRNRRLCPGGDRCLGGNPAHQRLQQSGPPLRVVGLGVRRCPACERLLRCARRGGLGGRRRLHLALEHRVDLVEQPRVGELGLALALHLGEHLFHLAGGGEDHVEDLGGQGEAAVAQPVEQVLRAVAQLDERGRLEKSASALDGVEAAEDLVQQLTVIGPAFQLDELHVDAVEHFARLGQKIVQQVLVGKDCHGVPRSPVRRVAPPRIPVFRAIRRPAAGWRPRRPALGY